VKNDDFYGGLGIYEILCWKRWAGESMGLLGDVVAGLPEDKGSPIVFIIL